MSTRIIELEPLRKLTIGWGVDGSVCFELEPLGSDILLTIVHRNVADRASMLNVGPGWHVHLDILTAMLAGARPKPFWDEIRRLKDEYSRRLAAEAVQSS
jgi:hypothetical protein